MGAPSVGHTFWRATPLSGVPLGRSVTSAGPAPHGSPLTGLLFWQAASLRVTYPSSGELLSAGFCSAWLSPHGSPLQWVSPQQVFHLSEALQVAPLQRSRVPLSRSVPSWVSPHQVSSLGRFPLSGICALMGFLSSRLSCQGFSPLSPPAVGRFSPHLSQGRGRVGMTITCIPLSPTGPGNALL